MELQSLASFRNIANAAFTNSRDVLLSSSGEVKQGRLGRLTITSSQRKANQATMEAFRTAMENDFGQLGVNSFERVLGTNFIRGKSLTAGHILKVINGMDVQRRASIMNEVERQLDTSAQWHAAYGGASDSKRAAMEVCAKDMVKILFADGKTPTLSFLLPDEAEELCSEPQVAQLKSEFMKCRNQTDVSLVTDKLLRFVSDRLSNQFDAGISNENAPRTMQEQAITPQSPTGLSRMKTANGSLHIAYGQRETSVEDRLKQGELGIGQRINTSDKQPVLLHSLKKRGVEPGFIYKADWASADTASMMQDFRTDAFRNMLIDKLNDPQNKSLRSLYQTLTGEAFTGDATAARTKLQDNEVLLTLGLSFGGKIPESMALASYAVIINGLSNRESPMYRDMQVFWGRQAGVEALSDEQMAEKLQLLKGNGTESNAALDEAKKHLFVHIRNAIMTSDSPTLKVADKFKERIIVKLDYNEDDRSSATKRRHKNDSGGDLRVPKRLADKNAGLFRKFRLTTAQEANVGAVAEALANDLTRISGVPAQELFLVEGAYSDGKRKLMLEAKFANGYRDMEDYLVNGQVHLPGGKRIENIGSFKAMFMILGDRDAVGSHGQNKGVIDGKFFAIDPGHSLEGNRLEMHSDFSFKDPKTSVLEKRFRNFSVFDDATRSEKLEGLMKLKETREQYIQLFDSYLALFPESDKSDLAVATRKRITEMKDEFMGQLDHALNVVFKEQLDLHAAAGPNGNRVIDTLENLEKLTSKTHWSVGKKGQTQLTHLAVSPDKRQEWHGAINQNGYLTFSTNVSGKNSPAECMNALQNMVGGLEGVAIERTGNEIKIVISPAAQEAFLDAMSEEKVIAAKHLNEAQQRVLNRFELLTGTKTSYRNADGDFLVHPKRVPDAADPTWRMTSNDDGRTSFSVTGLNETSSSQLQQLLMDVFPPEEDVNIPREIDDSRTELTFVLLPHQVAMLERKMSEEILFNIAK